MKTRALSVFWGLIVLLVLAISSDSTAQAFATETGCQCTDYVYRQRPDLDRGMGDARKWITSASSRRIPWSHTPYVGDVAVFQPRIHGAGSDGHVAMVTWVNGDRSRFSVAEWNFSNGVCVTTYRSNLAVVDGVDFIHEKGFQSAPVPRPAPSSSRGEITVSPTSPARIGDEVKISARVYPGEDFRAARLLIDRQVFYETGATEFSYHWNTSDYSTGVHSIRLEIAARDDTSWSRPNVQETNYILESSPIKANRSPFIPTLISPQSGGKTSTSLELCWRNNGDPDGDPVQTHVEVWGGGSWTSPWLTGEDLCWFPPDLPTGEHGWTVRARDNKGAESGAPPAWSFKLVEAPPQPPPSVSLTARPTSASGGQSVKVSWSDLNVSGNDWISLHVAGAPDSSYLGWKYASGSSGSLTFSAPTEAGQYEFRIFRNGTKLASSNVFEVTATTIPCTAPPIEVLSFSPASPATVGTTVNVHVKSTWNSCFRSMRLKIDGSVVYELGSAEWDYSWNTSGYSAGSHTVRLEVAALGDNSWSSPSVREASYTLQSGSSLSKPTLVSPANGALLPPGTDVTLQWNSVSGTTQYLVEIWGGQYGGNHATPCGWQGSTSCHIGTMSPGNVLWRVKARDESGNESPWSDEWNFTPQ